MRFTIVTPTLNRRAWLADALDSVEAQGHADMEHIVVDGGSTDGTLDMLAKRSGVTVITDRRKGLWDAINLGIERASGDVIGLLNSDDLYAPGSFAAIAQALEANPGADVACGQAELFDESGIVLRYTDPRDLALDAHAALIGACIPNARFFRRRVFEDLGLFSLDYPHIADREFFSRALIRGIRTVAVETLVYRYRRHGESLTFATGAERGVALRGELLRLARGIMAQPAASPAMRQKARTLEGRCVLSLAQAKLKSGDVSGMLSLLTQREGHLSAAPLAAIASGMADRLSPRR